MTDLMQRLRSARPTDVELDRLWPADDRAVVLDRILTSASPRRSRHRAAWLVAAAVTGVLVVVPGVVDSGEASAQEDLRELAMAAVRSSGPTIAEGTYLHVKTEAVSRNNRVFGDGETRDTNRESWTRWDGKIWAIDTRPSAGWREYHRFADGGDGPSLNEPTPEFAAALPDTPDELGAYLNEHVSGSNSHEQAMFVAVTDLADSHFLPPKTLGAALEVLADVDGVRTRDVTAFGRPAVEVTYTMFWVGALGQQSVIIDRETARVIAKHESDPSGSYHLTTTLVEVVDEIPAGVRRAFRQSSNGERVYGPVPSGDRTALEQKP